MNGAEKEELGSDVDTVNSFRIIIHSYSRQKAFSKKHKELLTINIQPESTLLQSMILTQK